MARIITSGNAEYLMTWRHKRKSPYRNGITDYADVRTKRT